MSNVQVALRVRPLSAREAATGGRLAVHVEEKVVRIRNVKLDARTDGLADSREKLMEFGFDFCYWSVDPEGPNYASQEEIFQDLGVSVLAGASEGYNVCLFAYGQTGSGKTYTMLGTPTSIGLTPRICQGLFETDEQLPEAQSSSRVEISFLEIYNERVRDLLRPSDQKKPTALRVREHPEKGPYVQGLSQYTVSDYKQAVTLLEQGIANRITASTHVHKDSSRSHAILCIRYTQAIFENNLPSEIVSKINLVDLAGSERADPHYCRQRITEGSNINKSLVTLGIVISALAQNSQMFSSCQSINSTASEGEASTAGSQCSSLSGSGGRRHCYVPYRDSVLTWLLKDSLGGNAKTIMVATISPSYSSYSETLSTLRYAAHARNIINKPRVNEDANVRLIRELREEISRLKSMLLSFEMQGERSASLAGGREGNLSDIVLHNEMKVDQLTKDWSQRWRDKKELLEQYSVDINRDRTGFLIHSLLPHLIALDRDVLNTGVTFYHLREGITRLGPQSPEADPDIVLQTEARCEIGNQGGVVTLRPVPGSLCLLNDREVSQPCRLAQGAMIIIGGTKFRFNHPAEAAVLRERRRASEGDLNFPFLDCSQLASHCRQQGGKEASVPHQWVEEQQRYVENLQAQIQVEQQRAEQDLEREQAELSQQHRDIEQWVLCETQRLSASEQKNTLEFGVSTSCPDWGVFTAEQGALPHLLPPSVVRDRKRVVQEELLRQHALRRAESRVRRKRLTYQVARIARTRHLLEAQRELQRLEKALAPDTSAEPETPLRRHASSAQLLSRLHPQHTPVLSHFLKRNKSLELSRSSWGSDECVASQEMRSRANTLPPGVAFQTCSDSLEMKVGSAEPSLACTDLKTGKLSLNKNLLIRQKEKENQQILSSEQHKGSKERMSQKKKSCNPVTCPKGAKLSTQGSKGLQRVRKLFSHSSGQGIGSTLSRLFRKPPSGYANNKGLKLNKTTTPICGRSEKDMQVECVAKIAVSCEDLEKFAITKSWHSEETLPKAEVRTSAFLLARPGTKEDKTEDDVEGSSDCDSSFSVDSLSSAYATALEKQLTQEESDVSGEEDKSEAESVDSQMSQDSLVMESGNVGSIKPMSKDTLMTNDKLNKIFNEELGTVSSYSSCSSDEMPAEAFWRGCSFSTVVPVDKVVSVLRLDTSNNNNNTKLESSEDSANSCSYPDVNKSCHTFPCSCGQEPEHCLVLTDAWSSTETADSPRVCADSMLAGQPTEFNPLCYSSSPDSSMGFSDTSVNTTHAFTGCVEHGSSTLVPQEDSNVTASLPEEVTRATGDTTTSYGVFHSSATTQGQSKDVVKDKVDKKREAEREAGLHETISLMIQMPEAERFNNNSAISTVETTLQNTDNSRRIKADGCTAAAPGSGPDIMYASDQNPSDSKCEKRACLSSESETAWHKHTDIHIAPPLGPGTGTLLANTDTKQHQHIPAETDVHCYSSDLSQPPHTATSEHKAEVLTDTLTVVHKCREAVGTGIFPTPAEGENSTVSREIAARDSPNDVCKHKVAVHMDEEEKRGECGRVKVKDIQHAKHLQPNLSSADIDQRSRRRKCNIEALGVDIKHSEKSQIDPDVISISNIEHTENKQHTSEDALRFFSRILLQSKENLKCNETSKEMLEMSSRIQHNQEHCQKVQCVLSEVAETQVKLSEVDLLSTKAYYVVSEMVSNTKQKSNWRQTEHNEVNQKISDVVKQHLSVSLKEDNKITDGQKAPQPSLAESRQRCSPALSTRTFCQLSTPSDNALSSGTADNGHVIIPSTFSHTSQQSKVNTSLVTNSQKKESCLVQQSKKSFLLSSSFEKDTTDAAQANPPGACGKDLSCVTETPDSSETVTLADMEQSGDEHSSSPWPEHNQEFEIEKDQSMRVVQGEADCLGKGLSLVEEVDSTVFHFHSNDADRSLLNPPSITVSSGSNGRGDESCTRVQQPGCDKHNQQSHVHVGESVPNAHFPHLNNDVCAHVKCSDVHRGRQEGGTQNTQCSSAILQSVGYLNAECALPLDRKCSSTIQMNIENAGTVRPDAQCSTPLHTLAGMQGPLNSGKCQGAVTVRDETCKDVLSENQSQNGQNAEEEPSKDLKLSCEDEEHFEPQNPVYCAVNKNEGLESLHCEESQVSKIVSTSTCLFRPSCAVNLHASENVRNITMGTESRQPTSDVHTSLKSIDLLSAEKMIPGNQCSKQVSGRECDHLHNQKTKVSDSKQKNTNGNVDWECSSQYFETGVKNGSNSPVVSEDGGPQVPPENSREKEYLNVSRQSSYTDKHLKGKPKRSRRSSAKLTHMSSTESTVDFSAEETLSKVYPSRSSSVMCRVEACNMGKQEEATKCKQASLCSEEDEHGIPLYVCPSSLKEEVTSTGKGTGAEIHKALICLPSPLLGEKKKQSPSSSYYFENKYHSSQKCTKYLHLEQSKEEGIVTHVSPPLNETNTEMHFASSDTNPFMHSRQDNQSNRGGCKQHGFGSASDVTNSQVPDGIRRVTRCCSADNDLHSQTSPFHSHLGMFSANKRLLSTSSSIEGVKVNGSLERMFPIRSDQAVDLLTCSSSCSDISRDSDHVDEIMLMCSLEQGSEMTHLNNSTTLPHSFCHQSTQTNTVDRIPKTVKHPKRSNPQVEMPSTWTRLHNMSLHLSQLIHNTSELLGDIHSIGANSVTGVQKNDAPCLSSRSNRKDSSTQTVVDIGVQTDVEKPKPHKVNVIVKVIGSDMVSVSQEEGNMEGKMPVMETIINKMTTERIKSTPDLRFDFSTNQRGSVLSAVRASTPILEDTSQTHSDQTSTIRVSGRETEEATSKKLINSISSQITKLNKLDPPGNTDKGSFTDRASSPIHVVESAEGSRMFRSLSDQALHHQVLGLTEPPEMGSWEQQKVEEHSVVLVKAKSFPCEKTMSTLASKVCYPSVSTSPCTASLDDVSDLSSHELLEDMVAWEHFPGENEKYNFVDVNSQKDETLNLSWIYQPSDNQAQCSSSNPKSRTALNSPSLLSLADKKSQCFYSSSPLQEKVLGNEELVLGDPCKELDHVNMCWSSTDACSISEGTLEFQDDDGLSITPSECNTDVLINIEPVIDPSQRMHEGIPGDLPVHNKFSNWSGISYQAASSLSSSGVQAAVRQITMQKMNCAPPEAGALVAPRAEPKVLHDARMREIERLREERERVMSAVRLDLSSHHLTVELAEARLHYGLGETDALLKLLRTNDREDASHIPSKQQLYDRHRRSIGGLRVEREARLHTHRRARSLSPGKHTVSAWQERGMPTPPCHADNKSTRVSTQGPECPSEIELLLKDYGRAREEARAEIARARRRLRERAEQEKMRLQQQALAQAVKEEVRWRSRVSNSTLCTGSSFSLSSGPTSGYHGSNTLLRKEKQPVQVVECRSPVNAELKAQHRPQVQSSQDMESNGSHVSPKDCISTSAGGKSSALRTCGRPHTPSSAFSSTQELLTGALTAAKAEIWRAADGCLRNLLSARPSGGWRYQGSVRGVGAFYKPSSSPSIHSFMAVAEVERPVERLWGAVRDPSKAPLYHRLVQSAWAWPVDRHTHMVRVLTDSCECRLAQPREFCCMSMESTQGDEWMVAMCSVDGGCFPPPRVSAVRGEMLPSAWLLQPRCHQGRACVRVVYLLQVDLKAPELPHTQLSVIARTQAAVIAELDAMLSL